MQMTREKESTQRTRTPAHGNPKRKAKKKKKWTWKKTFWLMFFTTAFAVFCAVGGYLFVLLNGERLMREYKDADMFKLAEVSTVYDVNGTELAKLGKGIEHREIAEPRDIPEFVSNAFIATEDRRFKEHSGVDLWSIGRAMVKDVVSRSLAEGGSTITQQLAKNMFLTSDKTFFRKATEVSIALSLENHFTKDEIITMYLNRIFFGKGAYGLKAAAKVYFNKDDLNDLKLWEVATLAAIPKAPSRYNPLSSPERSKERRAVVLQLMYEQGYITAEEAKSAAAVEYDPKMSGHAAKSEDKQNEAYNAFIDYMVEEATEKTGLTEDELYRGGYHIYTTMDANAQRIMFDAFNNDDMFEQSPDDTKMQGAMVITDHSNGSIIAMVGGRDYARKGLNRATVKRQPGSSFKPIVSYAPALETGKYFPWSKLSNEKQCFGKYCPTNLGGYTTSVEMTEAVRRSINIPAVWTLNEIGMKKGFEFAKSLGFPLTNDDYNLSIALGGMTYGVTPINMSEAYNAFANGGNYYDAYAIAKITDRKNNDYYVYHVPKGKKVMSEKTAYYMTEMMREVVTNGTGKNAQISGRTVAGKTGTTQYSVPGYTGKGDRDAWFVGYTPEWTAAVWMGYDKTDKNHLVHESSRRASKMFSEVMGKALQSKKSGSFKKPDKVEQKPEELRAPSGLSASYSENTKSVALSWNSVSGDNISYHVYRKSSKDNTFTQLLKGLKSNSAEDVGVFPGETYTYYVTAVNASEESGRSNQSSVTIKEETPETPIDPPAVDPPAVDPPTTEQPTNPDEPTPPTVPENPDSNNNQPETGDNGTGIGDGGSTGTSSGDGSSGSTDTTDSNASNGTSGMNSFGTKGSDRIINSGGQKDKDNSSKDKSAGNGAEDSSVEIQSVTGKIMNHKQNKNSNKAA
ncbi:penicillin-binding protein 2A [Paenibacillus sp. cl6col]|nr:penicillin-binding protein 2A [Paenibacillus sp. cl6col]